MIEQLATRMAVSIKRSVPNHPSSVEIFKFAISIMLNLLIVVVATMGISLITGRPGEAASILISFALLRQLTGGMHLKSNLLCAVFSATTFTVISLINMDEVYILAVTLVAAFIVLFLAPVGIEKQSRISSKYYPYMKLAALMLIASNVLILSPALSLSFLAQSITLVLGKVVRI